MKRKSAGELFKESIENGEIVEISKDLLENCGGVEKLMQSDERCALCFPVKLLSIMENCFILGYEAARQQERNKFHVVDTGSRS